MRGALHDLFVHKLHSSVPGAKQRLIRRMRPTAFAARPRLRPRSYQLGSFQESVEHRAAGFARRNGAVHAPPREGSAPDPVSVRSPCTCMSTPRRGEGSGCRPAPEQTESGRGSRSYPDGLRVWRAILTVMRKTGIAMIGCISFAHRIERAMEDGVPGRVESTICYCRASSRPRRGLAIWRERSAGTRYGQDIERLTLAYEDDVGST